MPESLRLRAALPRLPHTDALFTGAVAPEGAALEPIPVEPMIAAYRDMVRDLAYDLCELAPTTYLVARQAGVPLVALPIFLMRRFHHADVLCRVGSGISRPGDLVGRKVGVRAWSVTTGVWVRGLLTHEHGIDHRDISWFVDDDEHVTSLRLPENVERLEAGDSLASAFADGRIDAALGGRAGIGRAGAPRPGWSTPGDAGSLASDEAYPLWPDAAALDAAGFRSSGVYPLHGLVCLRADLLRGRPWLGRALTEAFVRAKEAFLCGLPPVGEVATSLTGEAARYHALRPLVGEDPLPYGIPANRRSLAHLLHLAVEQGLLTRRPNLDELFAPLA
jgi:4,5-dihydroxyphthalate decarboxylase